MSKDTQAFLSPMGNFPAAPLLRLALEPGQAHPRPDHPRPRLRMSSSCQAPPCACLWGLPHQTPPTTRLWLSLLLLCLLRHTLNDLVWPEEEKQWAKTKVKDSSEGKPSMRRMGMKKLRKYPSDFPWELYTLIRAEIPTFRI